jgi:hypothetical protein
MKEGPPVNMSPTGLPKRMLLRILVSYRQDGGREIKQLGDQNENMMIVFLALKI